MTPAKPKTTSSSSRPSMNQLAQSSTIPATASATTISFTSGPTAFSGGPNYNVNTSPLQHSPARAPMSGIGVQPGRMGMQSGMGMMGQQQPGMGQPGMGMNYGNNMGYMQQQQMGGFGNTQMNTVQYQRPF